MGTAPALIELLPEPGRPVDAAIDIAGEDRAALNGRPWVFTNMITSLDGATAVEGRSGDLGGPADQVVFAGLRAVADVILVGSTTVVEEDYRPPGASAAPARIERGQAARPTVAILTRSLSVPPDHRIFSDPDAPPIIITTTSAPAEARRRLQEVATIVEAGDTDIDLAAALGALHRIGHGRALLEGGPSVNGSFVAAGLIDEWNLTIAPVLAGGAASRAAHGPLPSDPTPFDLRRVWSGGGLLFGRWVRA